MAKAKKSAQTALRKRCEECGKVCLILMDNEVVPGISMKVCVECIEVPAIYRSRAKLLIMKGQIEPLREIYGARKAHGKWDD